MKLVIQRVKHASVTVSGDLISSIEKGLLVLVGITHDDTIDDVDYLVAKSVNLRIFDDEAGIMNRSVIDVSGEILAVSQFTLLASTKKGNRPSYIHAAPPEIAIPLYDAYCEKTSILSGKKTLKGVFGADMKVELLNDGPVTIVIDSKNKE